MTGEINKDFYCSADAFKEGEKCWICFDPVLPFEGKSCLFGDCFAKHRKHPTPEQFKEEYGFDYSDEGAVYVKLSDNCFSPGWHLYTYEAIKHKRDVHGWSCIEQIVCACTPFGMPEKEAKCLTKEN